MSDSATTADDTVIAGTTLPWFVPVLLLGVVATALAYQLGISGVARLRPSFASLVGLAEVMFAVVAAWLLLGERITAVQAVGGIVVLAGLTLARQGDRGSDVRVSLSPEPTERTSASPLADRLEQSWP